jgi:ribosome-associated toxin RatA of RatAB toxin-antitoxin module
MGVRPVAHAFLVASLVVLAPARAAEVSVDITRAGDVFHVQAKAEFEGGINRTWQVLTDYARYADYIPEVTESRVISRQGREVQVEQKGEARLLFVTFPIDVRLAITEYPRERIVSRAVAGNFREMRNAYSIEEGQGRILLRYVGRLVPDFYVPPIIGTLLLKRNIEAMFVALVDEMERQNAQAEKK